MGRKQRTGRTDVCLLIATNGAIGRYDRGSWPSYERSDATFEMALLGRTLRPEATVFGPTTAVFDVLPKKLRPSQFRWVAVASSLHDVGRTFAGVVVQVNAL